MCTKVYALVLMLFAAVSVYGQDNVIDEVVWVVGDEAILKSDVENERLNAQYEGRKFDGDPYCIIPEQLAIQKLFLHQAAIDSIEVSEQEIISDVERRTNWLIDPKLPDHSYWACQYLIGRHLLESVPLTSRLLNHHSPHRQQ